MFNLLFYISYTFLMFLIPSFSQEPRLNQSFYGVTLIWYLIVIATYMICVQKKDIRLGYNFLKLSIFDNDWITFKYKLKFMCVLLLVSIATYSIQNLSFELLSMSAGQRENGIAKQFVSSLVFLLAAILPLRTVYLLAYITCIILFFLSFHDRSVLMFGTAIVLAKYWYLKNSSILLLPVGIIASDFLQLIRFGFANEIGVERVLTKTFTKQSFKIDNLSQAFDIYLTDGAFPELIWNASVMWIPRGLWINKPDLSPTLFLTNYHGLKDGIGRPIGFWGEFLISGGVLGLVFGAIVTGLILAATQNISLVNRRVGCVFFFAFFGGVGLSTFARSIPLFLTIILILLVLRLTLSVREPKNGS